jgi:hypothetical protein
VEASCATLDQIFAMSIRRTHGKDPLFAVFFSAGTHGKDSLFAVFVPVKTHGEDHVTASSSAHGIGRVHGNARRHTAKLLYTAKGRTHGKVSRRRQRPQSPLAPSGRQVTLHDTHGKDITHGKGFAVFRGERHTAKTLCRR